MIRVMIVSQLTLFFERLQRFPWATTARTLRQRFREDRLGQTAGSLTFTTTIALVPLVTVALAVFTAFPMFGDFQTVLQRRLVESLVPDNISRNFGGRSHPQPTYQSVAPAYLRVGHIFVERTDGPSQQQKLNATEQPS